MPTNEYIITNESTVKINPDEFNIRFQYDKFCLFDDEILKEAPDDQCENTIWVLFDCGFNNLENMIRNCNFETYIKVLRIYIYDTPSGVEMMDSMGQHVCGNKRYLIFKYFNTRTQREMTMRIVSYNHRYFKHITRANR